ncbi:MAG: hypothetical protein DME07_16875 [Candidatus Rokuibacteriota bacterium]|nr:MAG: hypothetical protein DME07_16875 [Candidatus Rokubacteria bacterium]
MVDLAEDHHECATLPSSHPWRLRNVMPANYEGYCAIVTPWRAIVDGQSFEFDEFDAAYTFFKKPRPTPLTLTRWHDDFHILELSHEIPWPARDILRRFSRTASSLFVRCDHWDGPQYWKVDLNLVLAFSDPFAEMPQPFGFFDAFPHQSPWYLVRKDDEPLVYFGGSHEMIDVMHDAMPEKTIRMTLDDRYY